MLGQPVDLAPLQPALVPLLGALKGALQTGSEALKSAPTNVTVPFAEGVQQSTWLLTTFLDADLRIARGDGGSVFVLTKRPEPVVEELAEDAAPADRDAPIIADLVDEPPSAQL